MKHCYQVRKMTDIMHTNDEIINTERKRKYIQKSFLETERNESVV